MAHDEHHRAGEPPEVRDEAADTPMWVPVIGLVLLIGGAVAIVWQSAMADEAAAAAAETEQVDEGEAAEADDAAEAEPAEAEPAE